VKKRVIGREKERREGEQMMGGKRREYQQESF
jgi:hypothetical protein